MLTEDHVLLSSFTEICCFERLDYESEGDHCSISCELNKIARFLFNSTYNKV